MTQLTEAAKTQPTKLTPGLPTGQPAEPPAAPHGERPSERPLDTGSHDLPVTPALVDFMREGWAPEPSSPAAPDGAVPVAVSAARRAALSAAFPGERLVIPSGLYARRSNDQNYAFRPHSDYVYLTGDQTSDAVLVLEPAGTSGHDALLFLLPRAPRATSDQFWRSRSYGELWSGRRPSLSEVSAATGVPTRHLDDLAALLRSGPVTRVRRGADPSIEALVPGAGAGADAELAAVLAEARLIKDAWEIDQLRSAVDITTRGFADAVAEFGQATAQGSYGERWVEGTFWRRARYEGNDVGYISIVAGGPHATTLHWIRNDGALRPGDLVLLDMGAETRSLYTADITRTLPVDGHFTTQQRDLYQLVFDAQNAGIAAVRPGARFRDFHRAAMTVIAHGLAGLNLLPCSAEEALDEDSSIYRRWTLCSSGHMLGLDVHDCATARAETYLDGVIRPGQVLTVEPGLYLQADDLLLPDALRGIGIRIEDDLLVTDDGNEVLSAGLPREIDAIEQWMGALTAAER